MRKAIFSSFLQGGFECSTHKLASGRRLNMVRATRHDEFVRTDFIRLQPFGIRTVREGISWDLIESSPDLFNFATAVKTIRAAKDTKTEIIWDLLHFGWPDHTDVFAGDFPAKFGKFAAAFTRVLTEEGIERPFLAPVNEISFMAWAGGDIGILNPFGQGRGPELKLQLVRATIEAIESIWAVTKNVRIVSPEPVIHIAADLSRPGEREVAEGYRRSMFEAWDMISGTLSPALGGRPEYLDIVGVNYYDRNQWIHNGAVLRPGDTQYRPFRDLLKEVYERYRRPMFVAETGTENDERPAWFNYVAEEVLAAIHAGVDMHGLCLYPVANHPGWDDNRHCYNGLLDYPNDAGEREVYYPLAEAVLEASGQFQAEFQQ